MDEYGPDWAHTIVRLNVKTGEVQFDAYVQIGNHFPTRQDYEDKKIIRQHFTAMVNRR